MQKRRLTFLVFFFGIATGMMFAQNDVTEALYNEGLRNFVLKDYEAALKNFESLYTLDPADIKSREMLINTLLELGDDSYDKLKFGEAETYYLKARGISPNNPEIRNRMELIEAAWNRPVDRDTAESAGPDDGTSPGPASQTADVPAASAPIIIQAAPSEDTSMVVALLENLLSKQEGSQDTLEGNLQRLNQQQNDDRELFLRTILVGVGIFLGAIFLLLLFLILIARNRRSSTIVGQSSVPLSASNHLALDMDDEDYLTDERHSDVVRAKRLAELADKLNRGEDSWETIQDYVGEMNMELKNEILTAVEKQLNSDAPPDDENVMSVLMPLVTDSSDSIGNRSQRILSKLSDPTRSGGLRISVEGEDDDNDPSDPLSYDSLLQLGRLVDAKTGRPNHSITVGDLSREIAVQLNRHELDSVTVRKIGLVCDIGFLEISDDLIKKSGPLDEEETEIMRSHAMRGPELLSHADPPEDFIQGMTMHHERLDGSGYPEGLVGDEIPLIARVIGAADMFCAATASRPYHQPLSVEACLEIMRKLAGRQLDVDVVNALFVLFDDRRREL